LYWNHCEPVVVGITGRFAATNLAIGSSAAVCWAVVSAPAILASIWSTAGSFSRS